MGSIQAGVPLSRVNTNAGADDDDDDDHDDDSRLAKPAKFVRVLTLKPVHLEEDCPITTFSGKKKKTLFCKRTNNNYKFKGCFPRGRVSLNVFQILNGCIVEYYNFIGPFAKKLENLL